MCLRFVRIRSIGWAAGVLAGLVCVGTAPLAAQEDCVFLEPGNDLFNQRAPFVYITNPHLGCEGGVVIWADSAVGNSDQGVFRLIGSVRYQDSSRELTALEARYFYDVGRLQAQGRVRVTNFEDGSTVENGDLVYLRQTDTRAIEEMTVTTGSDGLRPRATVYPKRAEPSVDSLATAAAVGTAPDAATADTTTAEPEPASPGPAEPVEPPQPEEYIVVGDRIFFRGDSYFNATGTVEIQRDSLFAYADSAEYEGDRGELVLDGSARVDGSSYELVGHTVTLAAAADGSDEVRALRDAVLTGEDLNVTAPQIILHLVDGELDRMVAVQLPGDAEMPPADSVAQRPIAISEDIELVGDSLDLAAPDGVIERIFAAGSARSVSTGRPELNVSTLPDIARTDWIDADTIEVLLVPVAVDSTADTTVVPAARNDYEVERIIAKVAAKSLYRLLPSDSTAVMGVDLPAVSYMVADQITIFMVDGQADRVESVGQVSGWHLEPLKRTPPDSVPAPPTDSASSAAPVATRGSWPVSPATTAPRAEPLANTVPQVAAAGRSDNKRGDGRVLDAYLSPASLHTRTWRLH